MQAQLGRGVQVVSVQPNSVAYDGGIREGDIILQIHHKNIKAKADFHSKVSKLPKGVMVSALIHRNGANLFVVLKIPRE